MHPHQHPVSKDSPLSIMNCGWTRTRTRWKKKERWKMLSRTILPSSSSSRITIIVDFGVKTSSSSGNNSSSSLHLITTASTKDNSPSIIPRNEVRRYQRRGSKCASMSSLPGSVVTATGGEVKEQTNSHDKNVYLLLPATTTTVLPVYPATTNEYQKKKTQWW